MQVVKESHIYTDPVSEAFCPKCNEPLVVEGLPAFTNVECPKCSQVFQVPAKFGPFLLIELLGAGGMGGVYRAKDEGLNRDVAIKVMLQSLGDDIDFVETFQREAQAAAKLNNPHIAQIYSFGQQYGQPYIVMELVSHGSLEDMMQEQNGVDPAQAVLIGKQIAEGLREAAEAGLVHGDVKPENILFDEENNAKLVDFGLVALSSSNNNEVWGTPFYIAPEKVRRQKTDYRADIYSLGATLYHAIANKPPFDGPDATAVVKARFEGPAKPMSEVTGREIPPEVEALIQRMLEVDPSKRYPTYGSLLGDMKRFLSKAGPVSLKKSSHRIKIKGKNAIEFDRNSSKRIHVPGNMDEKGADEENGEDDKAAQSSGCKKMVLVAALIFVGLIALIGAVIGFRHMNEKKKEAARIEAVRRVQDKVLANGRKAVKIAGRNAAKIKAKIPEAMGYAEEATRMAEAVLEEDACAGMIPPEPEYSMPPDAEEAEADSKSSAPVKKKSSESAGLPEDAHPVAQTVYQMYMDAYAVKRAAKAADHVVAEVEASLKKLENLSRGGVDTKKEMIEVANSMSSKVSGMSMIPEIRVVRDLLSNLKVTLATVESDVEALHAKKLREKAEKKRLARKAAAEAAKKAAMQAHKEKVQNEKERIEVAESNCAEPLRELRFREALRILKSVESEIETEEAFVFLSTAKERVNRIKEFHRYLSEKANDYKFSKGGVITESDEKWLTVGSTRMFWRDFYQERFKEAAELIAANVGETAKQEMRIREYSRLLTNTALFLKVFYPDSTVAQDYAGKLAEQAVETFDVDADIIKRLLPHFFEE
ncbi:MAG: serine/threonine-protein kinase [Kiritimatiellia bacterium]